ncbi:hypothetical protein [Lysinibacillus capsici]|uniref:hypothetical protein n=1 Tax=Lysinibacillus capsici TaxID=2115968 RepID=UPI001CD976F8|nr:hypothetical protein [Lysinibacillus capsici]
MANIPAKIIERKLKKEGIKVDGYNVISSIELDYIAEANRLGMNDGITEEFEFESEYSMEGINITFNGKICEDYRQISPTQETLYYYPYIESCKIEIENSEEKLVEIEVFW